MSTPDYSNLDRSLVAFLGGDVRAGNVVYSRMKAKILRTVSSRAPDLSNDRDDVLNETFVLMMEAPNRYDPTRGSASAFITSALVPEAIQRIRAKTIRPGATTRRRKRLDPSLLVAFPMPDPPPAPETVAAIGYGSHTAMEASCDARGLFARASAPLQMLMGGLANGDAQAEIAADLKTDRFKVARMIRSVRRLAGAA